MSGPRAFVYDPVAFWTANGPELAKPGTEGVDQGMVLKELTLLVDELEGITSVLDVGCGQGRLAHWLKDVLPDAFYAGLDLGTPQLTGTKLVRPDGEFFLADIRDPLPEELQGRQWDLVLASEVLLHVPPAEIQAAVDNLKLLAGKYLLTVDWSQPIGSVKPAPWNWLHDYETLLAPDVEIQVHLQSIFLKRM